MLKCRVTEWQKEYIHSDAKYNLLIAGRRAGKTHAEKCRIVHDAITDPTSNTMYLTPDGSLCHELFRDIISDKFAKRRIARVEKLPVRQIFWRNGARTYIRMFDRPDKALGFGFSHVIFDELQRLDGLGGRDDFMRVIRPLIMDRGGCMTVSGQWRGEACWWYKWWKENEDNPDLRLWNVPSWEGVKFWPEKEEHKEILDAKSMMTPQLFDQEIACIPTGNANAAFDFYDIKACFGGKELRKGDTSRKYVIGADLGKVVDPSAWVVIDQVDMRVVHAETRKLGEKHATGARKLQELSQRFNDAYTVIDATGGATGGKRHKDVFVKFYRQYVKKLGKKILNIKTKEDLISKLNLAFQNQAITIPDSMEELIAQLSSYEAIPNRWGGFRYQGPGGHDDDLVIALAMAYDAADRGGTSSDTGLEDFART